MALTLGSNGLVGAPTPLVTFLPGAWSLRSDGGALAVSVTSVSASRIAVWDLRTASARWLTTTEPGTAQTSPVWSKDGGSIYYMSSTDDGKGRGIYQIGADGSGKSLIMAADDRTGPPERLTPDGKGLVWSRGQAGGSVEILDIATGVSRHLEDVARVVSWRTQQPRVLLMVGGCCAGRPGGSLVAWDDVALTSRVVAELGRYSDHAWGGGAWDPTGTRIAAVRYDSTSPYDGALVILDPATGATQPIAGTQGAGVFEWLAEGIVFSISHVRQSAAELMLLPNGATAPISLYKSDGFQGLAIVHP
jgi:Tol biopolymer transport system component